MKQNNKIKFKCKVCETDYLVNIEQIDTLPIWNYENCSEECHTICNSNKFLNLNCCTIKSTGNKVCI
jgi:hypothetical protein